MFEQKSTAGRLAQGFMITSDCFPTLPNILKPSMRISKSATAASPKETDHGKVESDLEDGVHAELHQYQMAYVSWRCIKYKTVEMERSLLDGDYVKVWSLGADKHVHISPLIPLAARAEL